jgi:cytochrome c-type biogenesis protein CcmH/NrfG
MGKQQIDSNLYIKKGTMWTVAFVALVVGFLIGTVFTVYKSGTGVPMPTTPGPQPQAVDQGITEEKKQEIAALEMETSANPKNVVTWIQLGNAYFDANQSEKAIQAYQKSLELDPKNANVITDMGVMYRRSGQPKKAVAAFEQARAADPKHEISLFNKGIVLLHDLNDTEGAIKAWEALLKLNPLYTTPTGQPIKEMVESFKSRQKKGTSG